MSLTVGLKGRCEALVTDTNTALAMGSGALPVLATPMMVALMEGAAVDALKGHLAEGEDTVGTGLEISHDAATPVEGRALTFAVTAYDEAGPIGKGTHRRFVVGAERFLAKAQGKKGA